MSGLRAPQKIRVARRFCWLGLGPSCYHHHHDLPVSNCGTTPCRSTTRRPLCTLLLCHQRPSRCSCGVHTSANALQLVAVQQYSKRAYLTNRGNHEFTGARKLDAIHKPVLPNVGL